MRLSVRLIWLAALAAVIVGSLAPAQSGVMHLIDLGGINDNVEHFTAYAHSWPPFRVCTASATAELVRP